MYFRIGYNVFFFYLSNTFTRKLSSEKDQDNICKETWVTDFWKWYLACDNGNFWKWYLTYDNFGDLGSCGHIQLLVGRHVND